jgi:hypothetical protein
MFASLPGVRQRRNLAAVSAMARQPLEANRFEVLELSQLEHVAGGGRIWNKIKDKAGKALDEIGDILSNMNFQTDQPPGVG